MLRAHLGTSRLVENTLRLEQGRLENLQDAVLDLKEQIVEMKHKLSPEASTERLVDLGMEFMYTRAKVVNPDQLLVDVGTGVFVELDLSSAEKIVDLRLKSISEQIRSIMERRAVAKVELQLLEETIQSLDVQ